LGQIGQDLHQASVLSVKYYTQIMPIHPGNARFKTFLHKTEPNVHFNTNIFMVNAAFEDMNFVLSK
jgi:hypothetical protein